jgi:hypothetical protein
VWRVKGARAGDRSAETSFLSLSLSFPLKEGVEVTAESEIVYSGSHLISTLPLGVMQHCPPQFEPRLSRRKLASIANLGMGLLNKIVLTYDSAWWRKDGATSAPWFVVLPSTIAAESDGFTLPQEHLPGSESDAKWLLGHNGLFFQDYTTITGKNTLICFLGPPTAHAQELLEDDWVVGTVHSRLVESIVPSSERPSVPSPSASVVTRWNSDEYSRGSYSYFVAAGGPDQGSGPADMMELARPAWDGRLGFAGEHTSADW